MQGLVTVFGGTGFIGRQAVRALARKGLRVRAAARNPGQGYRLRMLGDVGQIEIVQANVRDHASVARALEGAEACVNLVGALWESGRQSFQALHLDGARMIAEVAAAQGVKRFVQVSALGAAGDAASEYARTKAAGEAAVRAVIPGAVVVRPSFVFGPEDDFLNRFGQMSVMAPALPLIGGGENRAQPVFVGDVGDAIASAVADPDAAGRTFELGGPAVYSFREIMELVLRETGRGRALVPVPWPLAGVIGMAGNLQAKIGLKPLLTTDQVALLKSDNVCGGLPGLAELGVQPTAVEAVASTYLYRYRKGGQYADITVAAA